MRNLWAKAALTALVVAGGASFPLQEAEAQYKNAQIGFEAGYFFLGSESLLDSHAFLVALRGAYKITDHWWLSARAGLSFRGERQDVTGSNSTVVLFHLTPIDVRYYFSTDRLRPFAGATNSFQFLFNNSTPSSVVWGPGATAGVEIFLRRDLFLGLQVDGLWMFAFESNDFPMVTATAQLLFFL